MSRNLLLTAALAVPFLLPAQSTTPIQPGQQTLVFPVNLSPSNETPPVTTNASGTGSISIVVNRVADGPDADLDADIDSAIVDFRVNFNLGQAETLTGMHIHRGAAGVSGPIVIDSGLSSTPGQSGSGVLFRQVRLTSAAQLAIVQEIINNPGRFYLNVHTSTSPSGIMRGQLQQSQNRIETQISNLEESISFIRTVVASIAQRMGIQTPQSPNNP